METYILTVNGQAINIQADPDMPLLWVLRDILGLTGTKYGCGQGLCGACTIHLTGKAIRSCVTTIGSANGAAVTTIEGLAALAEGDDLHPAQQAWLEERVPQCGYCQPGQIMQAAALLSENPAPTDDEIDAAMSGNLCRCGTYQRIRKAIQHVIDGGVS